MTKKSSNSRVNRAKPPKSDEEIEAQVALDQIRYQAGGALTGEEVRERWGDDAEGGLPDPELDWSLTPKNIIMQLFALIMFIGVVYFLINMLLGSWGALLTK